MDTKSRLFDPMSDSTCLVHFASCEISETGLWKTRLAARLADELTPAIIARFHEKYEKSDVGCWLWKTGCYANGYGMFYVSRIGGRQLNVQAHRVAYLLTHGELPDGLVVRHTCDTPPCVNPDHLVLGTQAQNVADAARQGHYSGQRARSQKVTDAQIRDMRESTDTIYVAAKRHGVTPAYVSLVRNGHRRKVA